MDIEKVRTYIKEYKKEFSKISTKEIYKWQAIKTFQENWNNSADDFHSMLNQSLSKTSNLLNSQNYFPILAILAYSEQKPETIRELFKDLFNEEDDLDNRINNFKKGINLVNKELEPHLKNYQDHHAIMVYLSLRYPDRYYIYKFELFNKFINLFDYPYEVQRGKNENVFQYISMCRLLTPEIIKDQVLLDMHRERMTESEYFDSEYHILTQDFIYASVTYLKPQIPTSQKPALKRLTKTKVILSPKTEGVILKGVFMNYIENDRESKRIGDLGELLVLEYEKERLKLNSINKKPVHISKGKGDGLGYDILSYNEVGEEIYIEVKTTKRGENQPFYITKNELECSKIKGNHYFIYRLYDFDDKGNTAKYFTHLGNLCDLCINPIQYRIVLD